jgi:hypothetical protein
MNLSAVRKFDRGCATIRVQKNWEVFDGARDAVGAKTDVEHQQAAEAHHRMAAHHFDQAMVTDGKEHELHLEAHQLHKAAEVAQNTARSTSSGDEASKASEKAYIASDKSMG